MVLVKSAPAWRGGPISVRSGARRRHRDPVPHHPARLVAGEGRVTASSRRSVLEAALHAELLARPGRIDVGLAIEGEEVSLVLELAEQCPGVWPLSAACDLPGGVGRATWGSAQRAKLLPAFGRGYGTALGRALASALSINVRRSGRRLRVAAAGLLALNAWLTSRTVCSSAATSRAVARHERARRRRRDYHRLAAPSRPVAAARTTCCRRRLSLSISRRAAPARPPHLPTLEFWSHHGVECARAPGSHRGMSPDRRMFVSANERCGQRNTPR